jgi:hypothetical protein
MESREYRYRGSSSSSHAIGNDPLWLLLTALFILVLLLISLPAIIAGFFSQRALSRYLSRFGRRWSSAVWFVLAALGMLLLSNLMQHGLQLLIQREVLDYVQSGKYYQFDVSRWPLGRLWGETWPVWLRTLVAAPLWGLWFEITANTRGGQTARMLVQGEQARQRRVSRAQAVARKRAPRPERLPDAVADQMVMGVPVDGDDEQE